MIQNNYSLQVFTNNVISCDDNKVITKYYQPVIGSIATLLYLNLLNELDSSLFNNSFKVSKFLTYLNTSIDNINRAFNNLAKAGLVNIFKSNSEELVVIEIIKPKSVDEFFADVRLVSALKTKLSEEFYLDMIAKIKPIPYNLNGFTRLNDEVVKRVKNVESVNKNSVKSPYIEYFERFCLKNTDEEIEDLIFVSAANKLTKMELDQIIAKINSNNHIDSDLFRKEVELYKNGNLIDKDEIRSSEDVLRAFEEYPSELFLMKSNRGRKLNDLEKKLISTLRKDYKLNDPVINVLIDYVIKISNKELNRPFVETIASNWSRKNFKTASQAIDYVTKYNKNKNLVKGNITPEWIGKKVESEVVETVDFEKIFEELS